MLELHSTMKLILLQLFVLIMPSTVFLTTLLYGGITTALIKEELAETHIYDTVGGYLEQMNSTDIIDSESQQFSEILSSRLTPEYLQKKTETAIDDSFVWITGKSKTPPVISLKELKDDINVQNPELLASLETFTESVDTQLVTDDTIPSAEAEADTIQQNAEISETAQAINALVKNDFSIPLEDHLIWAKRIYTLLAIVHPISLVLLALTFSYMSYLAVTWPSRLKWMGAALVTGSIVGFIVILLNTFAITALTEMPVDTTYEISALLIPVAVNVTNHFIETFSQYQLVVSISFLTIAALCFIGVKITKPKTINAQVVNPKAPKKK
jgi:hypothetical protein